MKALQLTLIAAVFVFGMMMIAGWNTPSHGLVSAQDRNPNCSTITFTSNGTGDAVDPDACWNAQTAANADAIADAQTKGSNWCVSHFHCEGGVSQGCNVFPSTCEDFETGYFATAIATCTIRCQ